MTENALKSHFIDRILLGDCFSLMNDIANTSIDLAYLDPPFFSAKTHQLAARETGIRYRFSDRWKNEHIYADFLFTRISRVKELLKDTGSIFVHCDKSAEHIVRTVLDQVFGAEHFQSEIVWTYKRWSNAKKGLMPAHQNIYFYSKTDTFKFNHLYTPYSDKTNIDQILQKRQRSKDNKSVYLINKQGEQVIGAEKRGVPLSDVWHIPYLNPTARERVGYPTQKPLSLLQQIVELVTEEGDIVLDPFCGSGTTCVAAKALNRHYIGIDESKEAFKLTQQRLETYIKPSVRRSDATKTQASKEWIDKCLALSLASIPFNRILRNKGIDAILVEHFNSKPVLVKVQDQSETLKEACDILVKAMQKKQSEKAFIIQTHNCHTNEQILPLLNQHLSLIVMPALTIKQALQS
ncbi:DNA-methyltransferase [Glaciecola petra]|uniref:Methyltransferase n=1 Tax=Glaciecola petra TaxID=3075602 RepID=A0ABU2ZPH5_9ALTE|nr:site-specific DNA-methyltransferase [Aestuariibacter sp. P117]MDT0594523.1 site-specific DNA-methyltransferase [Aestuariibacter sp. P117]